MTELQFRSDVLRAMTILIYSGRRDEAWHQFHLFYKLQDKAEMEQRIKSVLDSDRVYNFIYQSNSLDRKLMSILIAEDNMAQRHYLREILEKEFPSHVPVFEASDGEETVKLALKEKPDVCILDIQMPKLSGVKAARAIWRDFPTARIIFWTQFPHEIYINEIRKIVKAVDPPPAYGFIHKNNPESRFLRFVAAVLEDGADMIDPAFKDSFKRPLLTEFEAEALYYLALGLSNWAIARKCSLSLRGVESRLATLYEKLFVAVAEGTDQEVYEKLAYNIRTRAFFEALRRGLLNSDELEKAAQDLEGWLARDQKRFAEEQKKESAAKKK